MRAKMWIKEVLLWVTTAVLLGGCAGKPTRPDVINVSGLIPITDTRTPNAQAYKSPSFDRSKYQGLYIEATTLYSGPDADFGDISVEERQRIAGKLTSEMQRVLAPDFNVVVGPAHGIARLQMTLVGIDQSHPVLSISLSRNAPLRVPTSTRTALITQLCAAVRQNFSARVRTPPAPGRNPRIFSSL